jgi:hypothetical protein
MKNAPGTMQCFQQGFQTFLKSSGHTTSSKTLTPNAIKYNWEDLRFHSAKQAEKTVQKAILDKLDKPLTPPKTTKQPSSGLIMANITRNEDDNAETQHASKKTKAANDFVV